MSFFIFSLHFFIFSFFNFSFFPFFFFLFSSSFHFSFFIFLFCKKKTALPIFLLLFLKSSEQTPQFGNKSSKCSCGKNDDFLLRENVFRPRWTGRVRGDWLILRVTSLSCFSFYLFLFSIFHKKILLFLVFLYFFQTFSLLALISEFNFRYFLRSRCSMEMWRPDDLGRGSWDWVGPPAWGRACFNSPEWRRSSSPVKTEPPGTVFCCCC